MAKDFLEKLFGGKEYGLDIDVANILNFKDLDLARLYLYFCSKKENKSQIFLPKEFIHPELQVLEIGVGEEIGFSNFLTTLSTFNYSKVDRVYDQMQFSLKGDVITVFTNIDDLVYRIEFFDNIVERILLVEPTNLRVIKLLKNAILININPQDVEFQPEIVGDFNAFKTKPFIYTQNKLSIHGFPEDNTNTLDLRFVPLFHKNVEIFKSFLRDYQNYKIYYAGHFSQLIPEGFKTAESGYKLEEITLPFSLNRGFIEMNSKTILLTDYEILSTLNIRKSRQSKLSKFSKLFENEVNIGDYVVHEAHGIGIYRGIETKVVLGEVNDYAVVEYLEGDKLLIPFSQLGRLSKYISTEGYLPKLTKLGTPEWESVRRRLKRNVEEVAKELLEIYAKKSIEKGIKFERDNKIQEKFESEWEYTLTEDQIRTLNEVKSDMESEKPMDRLIIGDVGFGKTEIALRAALKAVLSGKQVLVLGPTTILVSQLYNVFASRLSNFHVTVARVSRFDGVVKNKKNISDAKRGKVDILIGTHRLLSKDVQIPNLGLLIIDEEQKFGVRQKEKIRKLRTNIDVLSMSATPIPRTLQMALTGIKDISIIATPPKGRLPVHNEIIFKEEIPEKVRFEIYRGGQVFIVHNRVEDIDSFANDLIEKLPKDIKVCVGNGQMKTSKLEQIMFDFLNKKYDLLIATTIIENGLDIPSVNTIIIDDAHNFGLSQLYQLRGRVGRGNVQGFCYLVLPKTKDFINLHKNNTKELQELKKLLDEHRIEDKWITPEAVSRIKTILENQELGAGFKIASRDLEIRGSGNILGTEQSGQINAVGYELYIRLLEQEIDQIRNLKQNISEKI